MANAITACPQISQILKLRLTLAVLFLANAPFAHTQTYTVLYRFMHRQDGSYPVAPLVRDTAGNLYGTAYYGGDRNNDGVSFRLDSTDNLKVLHYFNTTTGNAPNSGLVFDPKRNAYGTTFGGGTAGLGVVYQISPLLKYTVLHNFEGVDGANPLSELVRDRQGSLYGTTSEGGTLGFGVIFKLDSSGNFSVLHNFTGGDEGANPYTGLTADPAGNLYGVTFDENTGNCGVIFTVSPTSGAYTVLHEFTSDGLEGCHPKGRLILASDGIYGTAYIGGTWIGASTYGTVFKLDRSGVLTVLHSFTDGLAGYTDGAQPEAGPVRDSAGNLYGTTSTGGTDSVGVVYKIDPLGNFSVLKDYIGKLDGTHPKAELIQDSDGNLYGTTEYGGGNGYYGVIFKITPQ